MRIAIVGSRSVGDAAYASLCEAVPIGASQIISGGAEGADALAERYALENGLPLVVVRPDYKAYGRVAPLKRNMEIIAQADYVLALWDGKSKGTAQVIAECSLDLTPIRVIMCKPCASILEN